MSASIYRYLERFVGDGARPDGARGGVAPVPDGAPGARGGAVIVEPRRHPTLGAVVANHRAMLPANWPICLWTAPENADWARETLGGGSIAGVVVRTLEVSDLTQITYSELLTSAAFWRASAEACGGRDGVAAEWLLVFQTDTVMFRPLSAAALARWTRYDYVGANYISPAEICPFARTATAEPPGGVQGGFSLRRVATMLHCSTEVSWDAIDAVRAAVGAPPIERGRRHEDIYFTHACVLIGAPLPSIADRREFSVESQFYERPIGCHGWDKCYMPEAYYAAMVAAADVGA